MRHLVRIIGAVAALTVGVRVAVVLGRWRAERTPRRELNGKGPVLGSLDTWPPVPRAPSGRTPRP